MNILHSTILGEGQPLLILHGYFGMSDNWKTLGTKFSENYQVHLIDQRNHGRSFWSDSFNYELMAQDIENYIKHHNLKEVILLGHSMGGKTAMLFSVTQPKKVVKLIVADIAPKYYQPHHNQILKALNSIDFKVHDTRKKIDEKLSLYIKEIGIRQFLLKNAYWKEKEKLDFRFNLKSLTQNNSEVGKALPVASKYEKPTLFLKGEKSEYITEPDYPLIKKHFTNAKIITIKNAGHWLHAENSQQFYTETINFLQKK